MNTQLLPDIADSQVLETRALAGGQVIRRRRRCNGSGQRVTTYEIAFDGRYKKLLNILAKVNVPTQGKEQGKDDHER